MEAQLKQIENEPNRDRRNTEMVKILDDFDDLN